MKIKNLLFVITLIVSSNVFCGLFEGVGSVVEGAGEAAGAVVSGAGHAAGEILAGPDRYYDNYYDDTYFANGYSEPRIVADEDYY